MLWLGWSFCQQTFWAKREYQPAKRSERGLGSESRGMEHLEKKEKDTISFSRLTGLFTIVSILLHFQANYISSESTSCSPSFSHIESPWIYQSQTDCELQFNVACEYQNGSCSWVFCSLYVFQWLLVNTSKLMTTHTLRLEKYLDILLLTQLSA